MAINLTVRFIFTFICVLAIPTESLSQRQPVMIQGKQTLPLKVLSRPFSHVYKYKDVSKGLVMENVPAFKFFYVYKRPAAHAIDQMEEEEWYEVGSDTRGSVIGWMRSEDVFEWKQTMCLTYTHPQQGGRKPVLMLEKRKDLLKMISLPSNERKNHATSLYETIHSKQIPENFPVISVEPQKAVDVSSQFYLFPILDFQEIEIEGREGRALKISAAANAITSGREQTDIRKNIKYLSNSVQGATEIPQEKIKELSVDLVWVMDTTLSMTKIINKTLEVTKQVSRQITKDPKLSTAVRFGFWGFRDSVQHIPQIGYTIKNYTPKLQPIDHFVKTLAQVKTTSVDSGDYEEDVFSGIKDAIYETGWRENSIKIIVLVGDAPGHEIGHPWNLSLQDEQTLRIFADDYNISICAIHISNPKFKQFDEKAEAQYRKLSQNKGLSNSTLLQVISNDIKGFGQIIFELTNILNNVLISAVQGNVYAPSQGNNEPDGYVDRAAEKQDSIQLIENMFQAALVEWIGNRTEAKAPNEVVGWAVDKDLIDPSVQSMEVRILINKRQLDSLKTVLTEVMEAGMKGRTSSEDFFSTLQGVTASVARAPDQIKNAENMVETGLIPEFLIDLPYKSLLMDMTNDFWSSMSIDEQEKLLQDLNGKIKSYQNIHDEPGGWIALNQNDPPDEYVYPLSLELLP